MIKIIMMNKEGRKEERKEGKKEKRKEGRKEKKYVYTFLIGIFWLRKFSILYFRQVFLKSKFWSLD